MIQLLPTEILDLVNPKYFNLDNYSNSSPIGCFLEADLDYPDELHDLLNDFLLVGAKIKVTEEMLSEHQFEVIENNIFSFSKTKNLSLI